MVPPTSWRSLSGLSRVPRRSIERFLQCQCRDTRVALQCDPSHRRSVMLRGTATDGAACFGCTARLMSARRTAELVEVIIQMAVCARLPAAQTAWRDPTKATRHDPARQRRGSAGTLRMDGWHDVGACALHCPERKALLPRCVRGNGVSNDVNAIASVSCIEDGGAYTSFREDAHDIELMDSLGLKIAVEFWTCERAWACLDDHFGGACVPNSRVEVCARCAGDGSALAKEVCDSIRHRELVHDPG